MQVLLRWFNFHLREAGHAKRVKNFAGDIKDSEAYTVLLHQLKPQICDLSATQDSDLNRRAEKVLANAHAIGCTEFKISASGDFTVTPCMVGKKTNWW